MPKLLLLLPCCRLTTFWQLKGYTHACTLSAGTSIYPCLYIISWYIHIPMPVHYQPVNPYTHACTLSAGKSIYRIAGFFFCRDLICVHLIGAQIRSIHSLFYLKVCSLITQHVHAPKLNPHKFLNSIILVQK